MLHRQKNSYPKSGFTLVEVLVSAVIGAVLISMGMSSVVMIGKSAVGIGNYSEMNRQSRLALEQFSIDVRMAHDVSVSTDTTLTFTAYDSGGSDVGISYSFDSVAKTLIRTSGGVSKIVLRDIDSFDFDYYDLSRNPTTAAISVKEVEIDAVLKKSVVRNENTNEIISSRFMMRNRQVSS